MTDDSGKDEEPDTYGAEGDPYAPLVDHAVRFWEAEEENARRLARRVNLQLTVVAAFLGLGVLRLLDSETLTGLAHTAFVALFLIGLGILTWAALVFLSALPLQGFPDRAERKEKRDRRIRWLKKLRLRFLAKVLTRKRPVPASTNLLLSLGDEDLPKPSAGTVSESRANVFFHTYDAAVQLYELNLDEQEHINSGQRLLVLGFTGIFLALAVYMCAGHESRPSVRDVSPAASSIRIEQGVHAEGVHERNQAQPGDPGATVPASASPDSLREGSEVSGTDEAGAGEGRDVPDSY